MYVYVKGGALEPEGLLLVTKEGWGVDFSNGIYGICLIVKVAFIRREIGLVIDGVR